MKKLLFLPILALLILGGIYAFSYEDSEKINPMEGPVHWITFEEAVAKAKKNPRPIMIDIYTTWCGPCKLMAANTFGNEKIAKYLNEKFYCVKFDAENIDTINVVLSRRDSVLQKDGKTKKLVETPKPFKFFNPSPAGAKPSTHQFASSILDNNVSYPSIVFLSAKIERLNIIKGYHQPVQFEPIMRYFGSGSWEKEKYDEFQKSFKSEL